MSSAQASAWYPTVLVKGDEEIQRRLCPLLGLRRSERSMRSGHDPETINGENIPETAFFSRANIVLRPSSPRLTPSPLPPSQQYSLQAAASPKAQQPLQERPQISTGWREGLDGTECAEGLIGSKSSSHTENWAPRTISEGFFRYGMRGIFRRRLFGRRRSVRSSEVYPEGEHDEASGFTDQAGVGARGVRGGGGRGGLEGGGAKRRSYVLHGIVFAPLTTCSRGLLTFSIFSPLLNEFVLSKNPFSSRCSTPTKTTSVCSLSAISEFPVGCVSYQDPPPPSRCLGTGGGGS